MTKTAARTVRLPSGEMISVLGQGTWGMAEDPRRREEEIAALRLGIDLGMSVVDTAETYADGGSEQLVGEAIAGHRNEVFLISKVRPENATVAGTIAACQASLDRLNTDWLDMYLLQRRGDVPLEETVEAFTRLMNDGLIRHWGVSNFDVGDLVELTSMPPGRAVEADQVLYNVGRRSIEWDLLPLCVEAGLPIMAYSPFERGRLLQHPVLSRIAGQHEATPSQVALAWILRLDGVAAIPRGNGPRQVRENQAALDLRLSQEDLAALDDAFPPPEGSEPLGVL